ncbi:MAG: hypothetical protein ACK5M8_04930 [Shewanella algae]
MSIGLLDFVSVLLAVLSIIVAIVVPVARHHTKQMELIREAIEQNRQQMHEFKALVHEHYSKKQDLELWAQRIDERIVQGFAHIKEILELKTRRHP